MKLHRVREVSERVAQGGKQKEKRNPSAVSTTRESDEVEFFLSNRIVSFLLCIDLQLKFLSFEELQQRMSNLDSEMEREIYDLRRRYQAKRQPIQDAIDQKKKRQQNFWIWTSRHHHRANDRISHL